MTSFRSGVQEALERLGLENQRLAMTDLVRQHEATALGLAALVPSGVSDRLDVEGLFSGAIERIKDEGPSVSVARVLDESLDGVSELPKAEAKQIDLITMLGLVLAIIALFADVAMDRRLESIESGMSERFDQVDGAIDSLAHAFEEAVVSSVVSFRATGDLLPTHTLPRGLHLRTEPTGESASLGTFPAGEVVQVLDLNKGWASVVVEAKGGEHRTGGWMYSRYLRRLAAPEQP